MHQLVRFLFAAIYPPAAGLPGIVDCDVDAFIRQARREMPFIMRVGVITATVIFVVSPLFTVYVPLPAFLLRGALLERHTERLLGSRIYWVRQLMLVPKMIAGFCWGAHPSVRAAMFLPPYPRDPGTWRTS